MKTLKRFINFINKSNVRRRAIYALILSVLFISVTIFGAVTYARFYTSYREAIEAQVAKYAFDFQNVSLKRKDKENREEVIAIDRDAETCEINDIQPNDVIDYVFVISDADGTKYNEVRLRVTLNITVRLETMEITENAGAVVTEKSSVYFSAFGHPAETTPNTDLRQGAEMKLFKINGEHEYDILPADNRDKVDYNCEQLWVNEVSATENGKPVDRIENKVGFYMEPYSGAVTGNRFRLQFKLPNQVVDLTNYAGARLLINVHADVEQVQATEVTA